MSNAERKPLVAGNWKMNKTVHAAVDLVNKLKPLVSGISGVEVVVCPTFTALYPVAEALRNSNIALGGQNCYDKESGAYTGEISPQMLQDVGCSWTIIGHSERRQIFKESDELLNSKLRFALESGLRVMFCIGETLEEREDGKMNAVLERQVVEGLKNLEESEFDRLALAYEPVWAIGTGVTASPDQAEEAHEFVRGLVKSNFGGAVADKLRIQYGGSVKPDNAGDLITRTNVDGFLVGGAALKAEGFADIIKAVV